ncbi:MAG TPA: type II secretion system F family protein [Candidatus Saccharimonadales bacterium]|nr:type II secretion system F family protein [Candidatus Saccharimonadales bacterium]
MLSYTYTARNVQTGERIKAEIEADNEQAAAKLLVDRGLAPLEIAAIKKTEGGVGFRGRVPTKVRIIFSRQLSTLINAGLPLVQSLTTVQQQTQNKNLESIIAKIVADIEAGSSLADALSKYPGVFDEVYVSLVAAGEASGTLDTSLDRLATQQEKDADVVSRVRGAMIYPLIVLLVLFGIVIFMTTTVLPQVVAFYKQLPGAKLPFITAWLLDLSHVITRFWWIVLVILICAVYALRKWSKTPGGIHFFDSLKMHMWPIGPLMNRLYMSRFARTSSTLIGSGVPMIKMLNTTAKAVGNSVIANSINQAAESVKGGKSLSDSLKDDPNFLDLVPNMIRIGEQSGQLEGMMAKVADYYEKEVDNQIKSVSTIIEPVLMIIVGVMALIIVAAVLLPIYSLAGKNLSTGV